MDIMQQYQRVLNVMDNYTDEEVQGAIAAATAVAVSTESMARGLSEEESFVVLDAVAEELRLKFGPRYQAVMDLADMLCGFEFGETRDDVEVVTFAA